MRFESSVTSVSWIPQGAVEGYFRLPFELGVAHYDPPPPEVLGDLDELIRPAAACALPASSSGRPGRR
jgi:hypothetical protein